MNQAGVKRKRAGKGQEVVPNKKQKTAPKRNVSNISDSEEESTSEEEESEEESSEDEEPLTAPRRNKAGEFLFQDHPKFRPNLSPEELFRLGSFGGTYWRPIYSTVTNTNYKNVHKQYPENWFKGLEKKGKNWLTLPWNRYDKSVNKYRVQVGSTLEAWEEKAWISEHNPYGWVHWYCDFFLGKRGPDDARQIKRWSGLASKNGRFRKWLMTLIINKNGEWNAHRISPKIRQTLQHWAYRLTKKDFETEKKKRGLV